jgi:D-3-phosphoglycerate dehydrogenase
MGPVFLTHSPDMLANYYGERAVSALAGMAEVRLNPTGGVLDIAGLIEHARGCPIIVSDRQTAAPAAFFDAAPMRSRFSVSPSISGTSTWRPRAATASWSRGRRRASWRPSPRWRSATWSTSPEASHTPSASTGPGAKPEPRMGRQLKGSSVGLIGFGAISETLAPVLVALGMEVLVFDPYKRVEAPGVRQVGMEDLLGASDFVVCLAVATEETENLMDAAAFGRMRRGAFFLNLSRGNLVDEAALEAALDSRHLAGAAMDVGRAPDQKPSLGLASRPDVIATPHTAGLTPDAIEHQAFDTVEQVRALWPETFRQAR